MCRRKEWERGFVNVNLISKSFLYFDKIFILCKIFFMHFSKEITCFQNGEKKKRFTIFSASEHKPESVWSGKRNAWWCWGKWESQRIFIQTMLYSKQIFFFLLSFVTSKQKSLVLFSRTEFSIYCKGRNEILVYFVKIMK